MGVVSDITALSFPYSFKFEVTSGTQEQRTIIVHLEFKDQFYEHKKYFMLLIVELSVKAISTVRWILRMLCY